MLKVPSSHFLCSAEQSRYTDRKTIEEFGIDGFTLMEVAATRAADFISRKIPAGHSGIIFCGKGNNAGDGLALARLLSGKDYDLTVCFVDGTENLSPDCARNLKLLKKLESDIKITRFEDFDPDDRVFDFIVDAMLGTGLDDNLRYNYSAVCNYINEEQSLTFALDMPTGLHADTGRIMGNVVQADYTLSFGNFKAGQFLNRGFDMSGEVILCELSFPEKYRKAAAYLISESWVAPLISPPSRKKHKYDGGMIHIIAGSEGLTGAAMLAARSAWAAGAGAVSIISPRGLLDIYEKNLLQIIKKPIGDEGDKFFTPNHVEEVQYIISDKPGKIIIGPGLGDKDETAEFVKTLLTETDGDFIIDADALRAFPEGKMLPKPESSSWILTPHPGELSHLTGTDMSDDFDRLLQSTRIAGQNNICILSKGLPAMVAASDGNAYCTAYDTRVFSRAGFGDVLAGKIAAAWLNNYSAELACIQALLNGKEKAEYYLENEQTAVEPLNII